MACIFQDCFLDNYDPTILAHPNEYAEYIIGPSWVALKSLIKDHLDAKFYYRVGYCPYAHSGRKIVIKTLLPPGYKNTPEYGLVCQLKKNSDERQALISRTRNWTIDSAIGTDESGPDYGLLRWFHRNGIPQVVAIQGSVFLPPPGYPDRFVRPRLMNIEIESRS
jgi:hypothetical protein